MNTNHPPAWPPPERRRGAPPETLLRANPATLRRRFDDYGRCLGPRPVPPGCPPAAYCRTLRAELAAALAAIDPAPIDEERAA
jgi:hypothetical protein